VERWSEPDVAVTMTVEVAGLDVVLVGAPHTPQPLSRPRPIAQTHSSESVCQRRRFRQPKQKSVTAKLAPGNSGLLLWRRAGVVMDVEMLRGTYNDDVLSDSHT
jgi:hypothetical protein